MNLTTKRYQDWEHPMRGLHVFLLFVFLFGSIETAQAQWSTPDRDRSISCNGGNVTSDVSGVAMKSERVEFAGRKMHLPDTLRGKALEPLERGKSTILVLLSLQ
jgi:hypothetical protein